MKFVAIALSTITIVGILQGCASVGDRPELYPDKWAPQHQEQQWSGPPVGTPPAQPASAEPLSPATVQSDRAYELPVLVDIALHNNPETQRTWSTAKAAAARFGAAQAPYYPQVSYASDSGYTRTILELPGAYGELKQWQTDPTLIMTWTLLDFGRREASSDSARHQLFAANLLFNRSIQDVIFNTETAFYVLDAAESGVSAAEKNLQLAETDFDAVKQRVDLGLATQPALLLAKARGAQSQFDLANARLMVHDAQAQMAVALGVPADPPVKLVGLENQPIPPQLNRSVEELIAEARRERPDLAASFAGVRASEADVRQARSQFFPTVGLSSGYGENLWNFTFSGPPTTQVGQPQYSALLTLKWDLFTGFKRLNDLRTAQEENKVARAELKAKEIDIIAEMWRAYFELESSRSKYSYAQSLVSASQESYDANLETYRQGLSTIVELLTAERDLANARYTLIASKAELLTAYAAVIHAGGAIRTK